MNPRWIEYMYILLSFEPFPYCNVRTSMKTEEKEYIELILTNSYNTSSYPQYNCYHDLFVGFIANHSQDNFGWLKDWKAQYHDGKSKDKKYYPELFKKICFFLITSHDISNSKFSEAVGIKNNAINDWHVGFKYRRMSKLQYYIEDTNGNLRVYSRGRGYTKLSLVRNGLKQPYITSIVQSMYFEWCRQYAEQEDNKAHKMYDKPIFVDAFTGTGTIASNMSVPSGIKVLNDLDHNMVCMIFMLIYHRREVAKRLCKFHNKYVSRGMIPACGYEEYKKSEYEEHFVKTNNKKYKGKKMGRTHKKFILNARNLYKYCEWYLQNSKITEKLFDKGMEIQGSNNAQDCSDKVEIAACSIYCMSFKSPYGTNDSDLRGIDCDTYKKYMKDILKCKLINYKAENAFDNKAKLLMGEKAVYKSDMLSFPDWKEGLRNSIIASFSFEELLSNDIKDAVSSVKNKAKDENCTMKDVFYYFDSPYFRATQYRVKFDDSSHEIMLGKLRNSDFKWIFSMQYSKNELKDKDEKKEREKTKIRKIRKIRIKDYFTYCKGFAYEFELNGKEYVIDEERDYEKEKDLFVILFDYPNIKKQPASQEMLIANFDSSAVIPYKCEYVQLPFNTFLDYVEAGKDYNDIVTEACRLKMQDLIEKHMLSIDYIV